LARLLEAPVLLLAVSLFFLLRIPGVDSPVAISVPVELRGLVGAPGIGLRPPVMPLLLVESCWVLEAAFSVELLYEKAPFIEPCERWGSCPGPLLLLTREERWLVPASWSNLERTAFGFDVVSFLFAPLDFCYCPGCWYGVTALLFTHSFFCLLGPLLLVRACCCLDTVPDLR